MRKTSSSTSKQGGKISDMFSEEEVAKLMHNLEARAQMQDPVTMQRSNSRNGTALLSSSPSKSHVSALSRLSMKVKNRKSMEIESSSFLRVSSAPQQTAPVSKKINRRNSMDLTRESSFRYRAGSDAPPPTFSEIEEEKSLERVSVSNSASFTAATSSGLCNSTDAIRPLEVIQPDETFCASIVYADDKKKMVIAATIDQLIYLLAGNTAPGREGSREEENLTVHR
jgi:hypothetical protein